MVKAKVKNIRDHGLVTVGDKILKVGDEAIVDVSEEFIKVHKARGDNLDIIVLDKPKNEEVVKPVEKVEKKDKIKVRGD